MGNQNSTGSRSGHSMTNLPPLLFSSVHGENVSISENGTVARRVSSFCKAIVFSDRPVRVNERVCIKFLEVSTNWSGVLRFGFSGHNPNSLSCLPRYACPNLTSKPGFWAKAFSDVHVKKDAILYYYVNQSGDVHFGINGDEKGVFFSGVDTRGHLYALIDIYGNTTAIEFVDSRAHLNNLRHGSADMSQSSISTLVPSLSSLSIGRVGSQETSEHSSSGSRLANVDVYTPNTSRPANLDVFTSNTSRLANSLEVFTSNALNNGDLERQGLSSPRDNWSVECVICCERPVDSVFYTCGHMCMCFICASNFWKTKDKGWCPICRAEIIDVIRTYKS